MRSWWKRHRCHEDRFYLLYLSTIFYQRSYAFILAFLYVKCDMVTFIWGHESVAVIVDLVSVKASVRIRFKGRCSLYIPSIFPHMICSLSFKMPPIFLCWLSFMLFSTVWYIVVEYGCIVSHCIRWREKQNKQLSILNGASVSYSREESIILLGNIRNFLIAMIDMTSLKNGIFSWRKYWFMENIYLHVHNMRYKRFKIVSSLSTFWCTSLPLCITSD